MKTVFSQHCYKLISAGFDLRFYFELKYIKLKFNAAVLQCGLK